jgi:hypothetical protein
VDHYDEESAITAAIEAHRSVYGMGDARTMARVVLAAQAAHKARVAAKEKADRDDKAAQAAWDAKVALTTSL